ncbi:hypothetical protein K3495_g6151 [Podosphaera aphanis]|nr:hypothetical protein K3495_g6151 [Podosphaera aphanis]
MITCKRSDPKVELQKLRARISRFFNNSEYSDVTIKIFGVVLHAHQMIICDQSEFFKKAWKKGSEQFIEAETKIIEFNEGSGAAYWRIFEYLYTGGYSDELSTTELTDDPELLKDVRVYGLADTFLIDGLKSLSETKFSKKIRGCKLDDAFATCVQEVYKTSTSGASQMRIDVVKVATKKSKLLAQEYMMDREKVSTHENLKKVLSIVSEGGEFARDLYWKMLILPADDDRVFGNHNECRCCNDCRYSNGYYL